MKKAFYLNLLAVLLIFSGCSKDDDENEDLNGGEVGTFEASVSGDLTEEVSGIAYFEEEDGEMIVTLFTFDNNWSFITFQFDIPLSTGTYSPTEDIMGAIGSEKTIATASNGDYFFIGESGEVNITESTSEVIRGDFDVNYTYEFQSEVKNINITGSFAADPE
ncbi:MAG: hypothetical protein EA412_07080 [Chitinophagaceae bacterium]|nr:MAG: hypothetical protein EA412_07080 [Chitinophagaceae bacterium]